MATDPISLVVANPAMGDHPHRQPATNNNGQDFSKSLDNVGKRPDNTDQKDSTINVNRTDEVDKSNKSDNKKNRATKTLQDRELEALLGELKDTIESQKVSVSFTVDKDLQRTVVKVVEQTTGKVVRQIPSEEMIEHLKHLKHLNDHDRSNKLVGIIFNQAV